MNKIIPLNPIIPYATQNINQEDIDAVVEVLSSEMLTQGPVLKKFEKNITDFSGAAFSVGVNSATNALHIACLALDLGDGDILWTSPISFVASSNCGIYCGASVDFVDIDPLTYNMSLEKLEQKLIYASASGKLPKIVIPVHLAGQSCDMEGLSKLGQKYGFSIIEDASHASGGYYKNIPIGSCLYSDIAIFSFHPVKIITTGEGGMALTNEISLYKRLCLLRSHGITSNPDEMEPYCNDEIVNYQQIQLGFNYRMSDIHAALGVSQIKKLNQFVTKRQFLAERYNKLLSSLPIKLPHQSADSYSSYHLYIIRLNTKDIKKSHRQIFKEIYSKGILVNLHYIPIYRHPFYKSMGFELNNFPEAESYFSQAISIPIYPAMTTSDQDRVIEVLHQVIN